MKKYFTDPFYSILIAIFSCILWGSAFPVLKISFEEMHIASNDVFAKLTFAGARFLLASIFIFLLLKFIMKHPIKVTNKKVFLQIMLLGIVQTTLQYAFYYNGLANTSGAKAAIILSSQTFFVILIAHFLYKDDRINWQKIIGLTIGFIGIILVNTGKSGLDLEFSLAGEGLVFLTAIIGAVGNILTKKLSKDIHPFFLTAWQMMLGSILLLIIGVTGVHADSMQFTGKATVLFVYSALLSATAFSLWNTLLKYHKAGEISIVRFVTPVAGTVLSVVFIPDETFNINVFAALLLVSLGIIAVNHKKEPESFMR